MIESYIKNYRDIISQIDEASLARFYLSMDIGKKYKSFFRKDPNPSASLYYSSGNRLRYNDFRNNLSLPEVLQQVLNLSYNDLLKRISLDFNLEDIQIDHTFKKKYISANLYKETDNDVKTLIKIKKRPFELYDLEYWNQFGITLEWLNKANITPLEYFWIINKKGEFLFKANKLSYSYNYYWYKKVFLRKIYQPEGKNDKWYSNINQTIVQNYKNLPKQDKNLIVTSSYKDVGTIECNTKIPSIAPNNELSFLPPKIIHKLNDRFENIYVLFDQDPAGHEGAKKYEQKYGWKPIFIPERFNTKDPAEYRQKYGEYDFYKLIEYLINEYKI